MSSSRDLDIAIRQGDAQRVRDLLRQNNIDLRARENGDMLWLAIRKENIEIIELLIRTGADLNVEDPHDYKNENVGYSILCRLIDAALENKEYLPLALLAIEHGADVNARNKHGDGVFKLTAVYRSMELMKALFSRGARADESDILKMIENAAHEENAYETMQFLRAVNDPSLEVRGQRLITELFALLGTERYNFYTSYTLEELLNSAIKCDRTETLCSALKIRCGEIITELGRK